MKQNLSEDLKRFNQIVGYQKDMIKEEEITEIRRHRYLPEQEEEQSPEGEESEGGEETPGAEAEAEGNVDFDFGGEEDGEIPTEEPAAEMPAEPMPEEPAEDVEEIDVTDIVSKSEEAKVSADDAAQKAEESLGQLQNLMDKFSNLEQQLSKMDNIVQKVSKIEADIKTPEEKLELRSLDSYPFNMKLTDFWSEKGEQNPHYNVTGGSERNDQGEVEYRLTSKDAVDEYSENDIKGSFNPEV